MTDASGIADKLASGERLVLGDLVMSSGDEAQGLDRVEPSLAALMQVEHTNLLVGAGLTTGLATAAGVDKKSLPNMKKTLDVGDADLTKRVEERATESSANLGRGKPNLEDRLRIALTLLAGLEVLGDPRAESLAAAIAGAYSELQRSISDTEQQLADRVRNPVGKGEVTVGGLLMAFLASFSGRPPTSDRLHVFTTNYDRCIEWGAELAGMRTIDRFVGSLQPVFRSSRLDVDYHYSPPGAVRDPRHLDGVFRLTKLHGSIDWVWDPKSQRVARQPLPFGTQPAVQPEHLMIFPNAAKDLETAAYPYTELFRDFSGAVCRPQTALFTYGYSFGDDHINRVIRDMLTIPSSHLVVISYDDVSGRIDEFVTPHLRQGQISLMIGPRFAALDSLVGRWLPRPSAEFILSRRAQIYRERHVPESRPFPEKPADD